MIKVVFAIFLSCQRFSNSKLLNLLRLRLDILYRFFCGVFVAKLSLVINHTPRIDLITHLTYLDFKYYIHLDCERARLGEGLVWDSTKNILYWVDIYNHRL